MNYEQEIPIREVGPHLAVSIGTALAVEVIGGHAEGRDPEPESRLHPEEVWVNLRTLIRNLHSGQPSQVKEGCIPEDFIPTLDDEMRLIREYVRDTTGDKVKVKFYACKYTNLEKQFPKAQLKTPTTKGQLIYATIENSLVGYYDELEDSEVKVYRNSLETEFKHVWLLTNSSIELLELGNFRKGLLLESHTGKLKNVIKLHSKLTGGSKMGNIPFNKLTLQVFGDKSNYFSPMPKAIKDAVKELAVKNKWTPATKVSNVKFAINGMRDRLGAKALLELLR